MNIENTPRTTTIQLEQNAPALVRKIGKTVERQIKCTKKIKLNAKRNNVKFNSIQII